MLIASFFLQLFALVSPLFFQVVIDKVLVHRSLSTLDVLVIGLLAISVFETVLGILRTYLFAHTTNRIDVELGARLFHHLLALPMAYFQARRVGDSVARVRELENIRNFLTSSALTLVIDLFFTSVFLAVMFFYSPLLTWIVLGSFPFYIAISAGATPLFRRRLDEKFRRGAEPISRPSSCWSSNKKSSACRRAISTRLRRPHPQFAKRVARPRPIFAIRYPTASPRPSRRQAELARSDQGRTEDQASAADRPGRRRGAATRHSHGWRRCHAGAIAVRDRAERQPAGNRGNGVEP